MLQKGLLIDIEYVWGNLVVGLPARSTGKCWACWHHLQGVPGFRCVAGEDLVQKGTPKNY